MNFVFVQTALRIKKCNKRLIINFLRLRPAEIQFLILVIKSEAKRHSVSHCRCYSWVETEIPRNGIILITLLRHTKLYFSHAKCIISAATEVVSR